MAVLKVNDVYRSLTSKGFKSTDGDHKFLILHVNGKKTHIWTKLLKHTYVHIEEYSHMHAYSICGG